MAGLDGFWIHLDVDVLDDREMPCVDSRQAGGLTYTELRQLLRLLLESPLASGLDITILDPDLDPEGMYTARFVQKTWGYLVSGFAVTGCIGSGQTSGSDSILFS